MIEHIHNKRDLEKPNIAKPLKNEPKSFAVKDLQCKSFDQNFNETIQDKSYYQLKPNKSKSSSILNFFLEIFNKIQIITIFSKKSLVFEILFLIVNWTFILYIPLFLAFESFEKHKNTIFFMIFLGNLFEIIGSINTEIYHKQQIIENRKIIMQKYFANYFFKDLLSFISIFSLQIPIPKINFLVIVYCFNNKKLKEIFAKIKFYFYIRKIEKYENCIYSVLRHIVLLHYLVCMNITFQKEFLNQKISSQQEYIYSLSEIFGLFFNNKIRKDKENTFSNNFHFIVLSFFVITFFVNVFLEVKKEKEVQTLKKFVRKIKKNVDDIKLQWVLYNLNCEEKINDSCYANFIENLPKKIKKQYKISKFMPYITKIDGLVSNFSRKTLQKLCLIVSENKFRKNDTIFNKFESESLFYIIKGEVQMYNENNKKEKKINEHSYKSGNFFNEIEFFSENKSSFKAKTEKKTKILTINKELFKQLLEKDYDEYQKYCEIRDKINIYKNLKDLKLSCVYCPAKKNHSTIFCPKINLTVKKNFSLQKRTKDYIRKNRKNKRILLIRNIVISHKTAEEIIENCFNHKQKFENDFSQSISSNLNSFSNNNFSSSEINENNDSMNNYNEAKNILEIDSSKDNKNNNDSLINLQKNQEELSFTDHFIKNVSESDIIVLPTSNEEIKMKKEIEKLKERLESPKTTKKKNPLNNLQIEVKIINIE